MRTSAAPVLVLASLLVLAACTGDPSTEATPTVSPRVVPTAEPTPSPTASPTPTPTTSPTPNPTTSPPPSPTPSATTTPTPTPTTAQDWTPPEPLTDDYAQRVMQELFNADVASSEIILQQAKRGSFEETDELTGSIAATRSTTSAADRLGTILGGDPSQVAGVWRDPPEAWRASSTSVLDFSSSCLQLESTVDPSPLIPGATPTDFQYRLVREEGNATGWRIEAQNTPQPGVSAC